MIATISSEVPTGRSMNIRDGFMSRPRLLAGLGRRAPTSAVDLAASWLLLRLRLGSTGRGGRTVDLLPVGWRGGDRPGRHARARARTADLGAVAQAVGAVDDDLVAR